MLTIWLLLATLPPSLALFGETCYADPAGVHESWSLLPSGLLTLAGSAPPLCAALGAWPPVDAGTEVSMLPCDASSPAQLFALLPNASIVLARSPAHCLNLKAYGKTPGTDAWVTQCDARACQGNCAWAAVNTTLVNSGLCLQDGTALPPLPHTCAPGSPSAGLPFCDPALDVGARVDDLLARLTPAEKVALFNMGTGGFSFIPRLNVKAWHHDFTCIRGVNFPNGIDNAPAVNVSVFPHAIAQAATFDVALVASISNATAYEARALNQVIYASSGGTLWAGTSCDGGPLANTVHDRASAKPPRARARAQTSATSCSPRARGPTFTLRAIFLPQMPLPCHRRHQFPYAARWGRISECYGEDVTLSSAVGVVATRVMQNRSADSRWLRTSQVTRHWLGYHMCVCKEPPRARARAQTSATSCSPRARGPTYFFARNFFTPDAPSTPPPTPIPFCRATDLPHGGEELIDLHGFADLQGPVYRAFQVDGGAEGLMCGYAAFSIGGEALVPSCMHPFLWEKLRDEWGWAGFVQYVFDASCPARASAAPEHQPPHALLSPCPHPATQNRLLRLHYVGLPGPSLFPQHIPCRAQRH